MKKIVFAGCSFTAGAGWTDTSSGQQAVIANEKNSPYLWTNLCHKNIRRLASLEQINIGQTGASNTEIFRNVVNTIGQLGNKIDVIFCQWTAGPRYNFQTGFELWNTSESITNTKNRSHAIELRQGDLWSRESTRDLLDKLRVLHHLHWEIVKVVDYSNIITNLAKNLGTQGPKVFFINGLCAWDKEYFTELSNVKPEAYTEFTKHKILHIDTRSDEDIYKLYALAHQHYREAGGINEQQWLNLYSSFNQNKTDVNFDQIHPGTHSNQFYYHTIEQRLKELNFI
jgi:hypothetical protein